MTDIVALDIVFDCADPTRVANFWRAALPGYDWPHPVPDGFATWDDWGDAQGIPAEARPTYLTLVDKVGGRPTIFFNRADTPKPGKNRLHLDIKVGTARVDTETERLLALGATLSRRVDEPDKYWTILLDPEGNELCVI